MKKPTADIQTDWLSEILTYQIHRAETQQRIQEEVLRRLLGQEPAPIGKILPEVMAKIDARRKKNAGRVRS
jgi:ubiquinone biosynthesis protein COQ9